MLLSALLCSMAAVGQQESPVLFTVDKNEVRADEFIYLYKKNNQGKNEPSTKEKVKEYFDLVVTFKLKVAEARAHGVDTTQAFVKEFSGYRNELKKPYVASSDELDRLVKEAYERMKTEVKASHILVMVQPDANPADTLAAWNKLMAARNRVIAGESFSKLAGEISEDPSARMNGGSLGYFTSMAMVYPFEDAAYKLKPGDISMPVRTRFGYHLIKVEGIRPATGEVEVSHILLGGTDEKTKALAFDISNQLKGGRQWNDLCAQYSVDTNTKDKGGKLPPFGVGALPGVPEFEKTAFSLTIPGEVSDPFSSNLGWHIIRLERKVPVPTFAEAEPSLRRRVARDERLQLGQAKQLAKRKSDNGFREIVSTKIKLEALTDSTLQQGAWNPALGAITNDTLFVVAGKTHTAGEFVKFVKSVQRSSALAPRSYLQALYDMFVDQQIGEVEDVKLQRDNGDYRNLLREYKEGIMFFSLMEKEVWNRSSADSSGQRAYYEKHKDKYKGGDRVYGKVMSSNNKEVIDQIRASAAKGDTLDEGLISRLAGRRIIGPKAFAKGDNKGVDNVTWAVGVHETEAEGMYYLVEIERLIPPGVKSFQEAKASVISDYQEELEKEWVKGLRKKHKVKLNKKAIEATINQLISK